MPNRSGALMLESLLGMWQKKLSERSFTHTSERTLPTYKTGYRLLIGFEEILRNQQVAEVGKALYQHGVGVQWKNTSRTFLSPTSASSMEDAESRNLGLVRSLSGLRKSRKLKSYVAYGLLGVDEIHPEFLKALDVSGLSWLNMPLQHCVTGPLDWQTVVVTLQKRVLEWGVVVVPVIWASLLVSLVTHVQGYWRSKSNQWSNFRFRRNNVDSFLAME